MREALLRAFSDAFCRSYEAFEQRISDVRISHPGGEWLDSRRAQVIDAAFDFEKFEHLPNV
jgi:hypothetical protein